MKKCSLDIERVERHSINSFVLSAIEIYKTIKMLYVELLGTNSVFVLQQENKLSQSRGKCCVFQSRQRTLKYKLQIH